MMPTGKRKKRWNLKLISTLPVLLDWNCSGKPYIIKKKQVKFARETQGRESFDFKG